MSRTIFGKSNDDNSRKRKSSIRRTVSNAAGKEFDTPVKPRVRVSKSSLWTSNKDSGIVDSGAANSVAANSGADSYNSSSSVSKSASKSARSASNSSNSASKSNSSKSENSYSSSASQFSAFVDARKLAVADFASKILSGTISPLGVVSRPKVIDFKDRKKERTSVKVRTIAIRVLYVLIALVVISSLVWLLFLSQVFRLEKENISISGANEWVSEKRISDIASGQINKSLFLVSSQDVTNQLNDIPGVTEAKVKKEFPKSLKITVISQRPAAMLKTKYNGSLTAVDVKGRVLNVVTNASIQGIPVIEVNNVNNGLNTRAVLEAIKVVSSMSESLRAKITKVSAQTQDSVKTQLGTPGRVIVWGDSSDLKLKNAIVEKIINDPSKIGNKTQLDVSAPTRPILK